MDNKKIEELRELILNNEDYNEIVEKYGIDNIIESLTTFSEAIVMIADTIKEVVNVFIEVVTSDEFKGAIRKSDLFEKALDMCDADIKWRYDYLNNLLCDLEDKEAELYQAIVEAEIDAEIAKSLSENYNRKLDLSKTRVRKDELNKELEKIRDTRDVVEDLFDEVYFNILANLE